MIVSHIIQRHKKPAFVRLSREIEQRAFVRRVDPVFSEFNTYRAPIRGLACLK
jgi:hypothetical protein